jgi:pimeloyl-ACP methyl ester carboxylesterase
LKELVETLPDAVYLELPKTGHYLNIEEPEAFTEALVCFIEEHPPRGGFRTGD